VHTGVGEPFQQRPVKKKMTEQCCEQCFSEVDIMPENLDQNNKDDRLKKEYS